MIDRENDYTKLLKDSVIVLKCVEYPKYVAIDLRYRARLNKHRTYLHMFT